MSQLLTQVELTSDLVAGLAVLCDTPYEPGAISSVCTRNGWELIPPEDSETGGDPFLRVQLTSNGPPMIALFGAESIAGLPLTVVFQDDVTVEISKSTWDTFDSCFHDAKRICENELGSAVLDGTYATDLRPRSFHFAFFQRQYSTLAILQHHEGDGHLGNDASLDIRIIPMIAEQIQLPLKTDLIF